jgi:diguanylate cyclase (GGDEF)-like protein/PAS domain S-box-containing protein
MSSEKNRRILVIDDNRAIHDDFRKILAAGEAPSLDDLEDELFGPPTRRAQQRYQLDSAFQGEEGFDKVRAARDAGAPYALAFVDMRMPPGWDGVETIGKIWEVDPEIQIVICSAYSDYSWDELLARFGAADRLLILKKPFDTVEVSQLTCALTEKWFLARHASLKLCQLRSMVEEQTRELNEANRQLEAEVAERQRSEHALRASEDRYALALAGANDGLWDWDRQAGTIFYSARWKSMLGFEDAELSSSPEAWFDRVHPEDRDRLLASLADHLEGRAGYFHAEHRVRHKDEQYRWMLCRGLAVRGPTGQAVRIAGSQTDITDRRMAEEQLRFGAFHDALTGLANRALLIDRLERCLRRSSRHGDEQFAVLYFDLDRFKVINDSLGHMIGDQLLIAIAQRLTAEVREIDTVAVPHENHLVRLGGDEFVVLLERISQPADAIRVAERVQQAIAAPFKLSGHEIFSSSSIGIALSRPGYERPEDILRDADTALYRAKAAGRGGYQVFDPQMHAAAMARWRTENELRRALERDELRVFYQPIMSVETGELLSFEALVRWQHPERGLVPPNDFIPLAEETGLVVPLGLWVLRQACHQLRRWEAQHPGLPPLSVAVNVSSKQLVKAGLVEETARLLAETGLAPAQLTLEITESVFLDCASSMMDRLGELRALGVRFHLDDFGTGYSSLSYLHRMPIDGLKIDRSFVNAMSQDPMSASIVQAIVALAHSLGMGVVAEGVETRAQLDQLRAIRCQAAQGYYLHRPLDVENAGALLASLSRVAAKVA